MADRKLLTLIASMAMVAALALAGCGGSQPAPSASSAPESSAASSAAVAESSSTAAAESASSSAAAPAPAPASQASDAYIGEEAALEAALAHAGVNRADATEQQVELDTDDATVHYKVEFKSAGTEYSYDIDATTGEVMNFESEADD